MAFRRLSLLLLAFALICAGALPAQAEACHGLAPDKPAMQTNVQETMEPDCHGHVGTTSVPAPSETGEETSCPDQACCCAFIVKALAPATASARTGPDGRGDDDLADPGRPSGCRAPELPPPRA